MTNRQDNHFIKKIRKIKHIYSHVILYAPHNFAESNHSCGDLIFRDFYQQTFETLNLQRLKKILWLLRYIPTVKKNITNIILLKIFSINLKVKTF